MLRGSRQPGSSRSNGLRSQAPGRRLRPAPAGWSALSNGRHEPRRLAAAHRARSADARTPLEL